MGFEPTGRADALQVVNLLLSTTQPLILKSWCGRIPYCYEFRNGFTSEEIAKRVMLSLQQLPPTNKKGRHFSRP